MKISLQSIGSQSYDYTIIGTGPAGLSLALALEKKGKKVLILEGGGYEFSSISQSIYNGESIGTDYYSVMSSRLRFFGGTSNHWGGWCRPLSNIDLENFPINKNDLDQYLSEASNILEISGKFDKDEVLNNDFEQIEFQFSPPVRFNKKYKKHIEQSGFINLVLHANVLSIRGKNKNVEYIEVSDNYKKKYKLPVKNLIVACGGIENSRLLLWSQLLSKDLFKHLKIGKSWMEHPSFFTGSILGYTSKVFNFFSKIGDSLPAPEIIHKDYSKKVFLQPSESLIREHSIGNAGLRLRLENSPSVLRRMVKEIACLSPEYGQKLLSLVSQNLVCSMSILTVWEQKPSKENYIELDLDKKDRYGIPRVKLNWKLRQVDKKTPLICMEKLGDFFLDKDMGRVGMLPYLMDTSEFSIENAVEGQGHHMGGTQMGNNARNGVVDRNLKVFNVNNLWIAGSSVFPSGGHANPTLTIVQLSLRLADHLIEIELDN